MSRRLRRAPRTADSLLEEEAAGHRHARLRHILSEELDTMFRAELSDPRLEDLRITALELSIDCRHARVYFAHPSADEAVLGIARALPFIRVQLAGRLRIKRVPELRFEVDPRAGEPALELGEEDDSGPIDRPIEAGFF
jgi:ribosome-binding factor A